MMSRSSKSNGLAYKNRSQDFIRVIDDDNDKYDYKNVYKQITSTYRAIHNLRSAIGHSTYTHILQHLKVCYLLIPLIYYRQTIFKLISRRRICWRKFFFKGNSNRKHVNSIPDDQIFHFRDNPLPSAPDSLMEAVRSFCCTCGALFD